MFNGCCCLLSIENLSSTNFSHSSECNQEKCAKETTLVKCSIQTKLIRRFKQVTNRVSGLRIDRHTRLLMLVKLVEKGMLLLNVSLNHSIISTIYAIINYYRFLVTLSPVLLFTFFFNLNKNNTLV